MSMPNVVSPAEWEAAREAFLVKEKLATKARDALNAERRQLPMMKVEKSYQFEGPDGALSLADLFEGRSQLILYNFMFGPDWDEGCVGCSMLVDNMGHAAHLNVRDVTRVLVSRAPLEKLEAFKQRMGWDIPWYSSLESDFNFDFGASTTEGEETFKLNVFLRDGDDIYRTYALDGRGGEYLGSNWTYLDLTPYGRQELWEASPDGVPQSPPYMWWRLHDKYGK